jgi:hypothetical protein
MITGTSIAHWPLIRMWTLLQVIDALMADPRLGRNLTAPSISAGRDNLYMRGKCLRGCRDTTAPEKHAPASAPAATTCTCRVTALNPPCRLAHGTLRSARQPGSRPHLPEPFAPQSQ